MGYGFKVVHGKNSRSNLVIAGLMVAALAGLLWFHAKRPVVPRATARGQTNEAPSFQSSVAMGLDDQLHTAAKKLAGATDAAGKQQALARLKTMLASGTTGEMSRAIRRLLDSKVDAPTSQGFKIGKGGFLTEAPTLRACLLDYLAQIDPTAAAEYAKVILSSKDSPDEWALALRNLARGDATAEARALLTEKTGELLNAHDWQQNPAASYLEAFDTAVYLGGTNFVPALAGMVNLQNNPALAHAAFLSLDRLVINDPTAMLSALLAQPELLTGRDAVRADYFARADMSNPQQLELIQNYLLNPQTSAAELQQFAGIFPNGNFMVSDNLLTESPVLDPGEIKRRDAASLNAVQTWITDPRFAKVQPELQRIQTRLQEFVRQGGGN